MCKHRKAEAVSHVLSVGDLTAWFHCVPLSVAAGILAA